jgi:hypothetical protein
MITIRFNESDKIRYVWGSMNRQLFIAAIAFFTLFLGLCRDDHDRPKDTDTRRASSAVTNSYDPFTDTVALNALMDRIIALQISAAEGKDKSIQKTNRCRTRYRRSMHLCGRHCGYCPGFNR